MVTKKKRRDINIEKRMGLKGEKRGKRELEMCFGVVGEGEGERELNGSKVWTDQNDTSYYDHLWVFGLAVATKIF